jgi:hypothetical protein
MLVFTIDRVNNSSNLVPVAPFIHGRINLSAMMLSSAWNMQCPIVNRVGVTIILRRDWFPQASLHEL